MDWVTSIHQAIQYIEEHLREELTIREIAQQAALSPFYFQKGFAMLCGMTVGDYIRQRRLSAAGLEAVSYTHLDVYKRQMQHRCSRSRFSCVRLRNRSLMGPPQKNHKSARPVLPPGNLSLIHI